MVLLCPFNFLLRAGKIKKFIRRTYSVSSVVMLSCFMFSSFSFVMLNCVAFVVVLSVLLRCFLLHWVCGVVMCSGFLLYFMLAVCSVVYIYFSVCSVVFGVLSCVSCEKEVKRK